MDELADSACSAGRDLRRKKRMGQDRQHSRMGISQLSEEMTRCKMWALVSVIGIAAAGTVFLKKAIIDYYRSAIR